ncbi:Protein CPR-5 [Platanthera guangdongensis]|uniref:Protein CPR-5 n=1 Tax=Platanthera guangdongensis TaxID=2320717 RepID=A0ABR2N546_9ASPA
MDGPSSSLRRHNPAEGASSEDSAAAPPLRGTRALRKRKGFAVSKVKKSSSTSTAFPAREQKQRCSSTWGQNHVGDPLQDLALPLGMSFAAVLSQVFRGKVISRDQLPAENLSMICTSAVKESISNIYGDTFDSFIRNFEKSFDSTLKTLLVIDKVSTSRQKNRLRDERPLNVEEIKLLYESFSGEQGNSSCSSLGSIICNEHLREPEALDSTSQLVLCCESDQHLVGASHNMITPAFSESIMTTYEKSVFEQTRSNNLKEVELGLTVRKLQMKQSQLAMSSYANFLEKVKICMNVSKAAFREEKLRNQIRDSKHADLIKICIDLLVSGMILMCVFLIYGASIFSYQRITEATSSCTKIPKESKSWWMPKQMASFSSGWLQLRCHAVAITRMVFGLLMILVMSYSLLQRSSVSQSTMPVTSILFLLGIACGIAGKLCIDSLGGSGYRWLVYWETLCLIHLFANLFPSLLYRALYGRILVTGGERAVRTPYWIRKYAFYCTLLLVLPTMAGLLPFASTSVWKDHFVEKAMALISTAERRGREKGTIYRESSFL